jgi:hypothetical protein
MMTQISGEEEGKTGEQNQKEEKRKNFIEIWDQITKMPQMKMMGSIPVT